MEAIAFLIALFAVFLARKANKRVLRTHITAEPTGSLDRRRSAGARAAADR